MCGKSHFGVVIFCTYIIKGLIKDDMDDILSDAFNIYFETFYQGRSNSMLPITETNEIIEREMNDNEFAQWQADQATATAKAQAEAQAAAKKAAAEAKLAALGLTADDLKALGL